MPATDNSGSFELQQLTGAQHCTAVCGTTLGPAEGGKMGLGSDSASKSRTYWQVPDLLAESADEESANSVPIPSFPVHCTGVVLRTIM